MACQGPVNLKLSYGPNFQKVQEVARVQRQMTFQSCLPRDQQSVWRTVEQMNVAWRFKGQAVSICHLLE